MQSKAVTLAIVIAVCLIHFSYVDFRFRHRGSIMWFWLVAPAPKLMWVSRAAILGALIVAIATAFLGVGLASGIAMAALILVHIATLIVVEIREDDWPPPTARPDGPVS